MDRLDCPKDIRQANLSTSEMGLIAYVFKYEDSKFLHTVNSDCNVAWLPALDFNYSEHLFTSRKYK